MEPLKRIVTPPDWNAEKDCEFFEERWDPEPSYTAALWEWMSFHHTIFVHTLDGALTYFRVRDARLVYIEPTCLTPVEKTRCLLDFAKNSSLVATYRSRLMEALQTCRFAELERQRVVRAYQAAGENSWMFPVIEAIDWVGYASLLLKEAMDCENTDYRALTDPAEEDETDEHI